MQKNTKVTEDIQFGSCGEWNQNSEGNDSEDDEHRAAKAAFDDVNRNVVML